MNKEKLKRAYRKLRSAYRDLADLREEAGSSRLGRVLHYVGEACLLLERFIGEKSSSSVEPDPQPSP
jgi:hypothetical protein